MYSNIASYFSTELVVGTLNIINTNVNFWSSFLGLFLVFWVYVSVYPSKLSHEFKSINLKLCMSHEKILKKKP